MAHQLEVTAKEVSIYPWWYAYWMAARPFRGLGVKLLDPIKTGGATLTYADVWHYLRTGAFPPYDRLALDPAWGYPFYSQDGTADRKEFHQWRADARGFPGRKLSLTYADAWATRRAVHFKQFQLLGIRTIHDQPVDYATFRMVSRGENYWWVNAGVENWEGWSWRGEPVPEAADPKFLETLRAS